VRVYQGPLPVDAQIKTQTCGGQVKRVVATLAETGSKVREPSLTVSYRGKEQRWKR